MKLPSWAKAIAIIATIFGAYGILGNAQLLIMPAVLEMQEGMMSQIEEQNPTDTIYTYSPIIDEVSGDTIGTDTSYTVFNGIADQFGNNPFGNMFNVEPEITKWYKTFGVIGIFVALLFTVGAIFMFFPKAFAPKLFYAVLAISFVFRVCMLVVFLSADNLFINLSAMTSGIVIISDITFFIITLTSNKNFYLGINDDDDLMVHLTES